MRRTTRKSPIIGAALLLASVGLAACGEAGSDSGSDESDVEVAENAADEFEDGTRMKELAESGEITIGVKYDQPGIGFMGAASEMPEGFDPEMGKILAGSLGIAPEDITWKETISDNREPFLQANEVDLVIASYSITDDRRKVVGQAGPYYVTGQQLLVAADSDIETLDDVRGTEVCSVTGSTSLDNIEAEGATPRGFDTYSECIDQVLNGTVDAMTTDGAILLGYAAEQPDELKVVVEPFSEERYGVGYSKDYPEMCQWINDTIEQSFEDGSWEDAFASTLGEAGVEAPEQPELDPCEEA
jgi:glutamate transport system substrate-binding protein